MRAVITGAAGFIGSHLCEFLLARGWEVVGMDNYITGSPDNLVGARRHPRLTFVEHNVTEYIALDGGLDWVLHFASPASPRDYLELPIQTLKVGALGTLNALGLAKAKGAGFLLASTSEVYGDPLVHPQREDYWGNVNPVGPRGVYDEAKRYAEALTMAYRRTHAINTRIVRIFNSIPADELTVVFDNDELYFGPIGDYAALVAERGTEARKILVPAFDPATCRMGLREVSAVIKHPCRTDVYEVRTRYGRRIRVTADHSVFRRSDSGEPEAIPVRDLAVGDDIAIPAILPAVEKDLTHAPLADHLIRTRPEPELWRYALTAPSLRAVVNQRAEDIHRILASSGRFHARRLRNAVGCARRQYARSALPLWVIARLGLPVPDDASIRLYKAGRSVTLPNRIAITDDVLWLIGLFLAEGGVARSAKGWAISFCSDERFIHRAAAILQSHFGVHVVRWGAAPGRAPTIYVNSKLLYVVFDELLGLLRPELPAWILQLPLHRLKWVVEGYRAGDRTHSGKKVGHELCFDTASEQRAKDLTLMLLRFGIVASVGRYETTFKKRDGDRRFPFHRLTVCALDTFDVLQWDRGVRQTLNARRHGDLVWARVRSIEKSVVTPYVYDFSVPEAENFFGGNGVCCHNTFGPRMRLNDGRAIPAFATQALTNSPVTVFGDGLQTRSFQYIDDLVAGVWSLLQAPVHEPVNIGNPQEMTLLELAKRILRLTGSKSEIVFRPLPEDDPKVRQPDIGRARTLLGWEPRIDTDEGLRLTLEWFRGKLRG